MVYYLYTENSYGDRDVLYDIESWCWKNEYCKDEVNCWRTKYVVTPIDKNIIKYVFSKTKSGDFDFNSFMDGVEAIHAIKKVLNPEYGHNKETDLKTAGKRDTEYQQEIDDILTTAAKDMGLKIGRD